MDLEHLERIVRNAGDDGNLILGRNETLALIHQARDAEQVVERLQRRCTDLDEQLRKAELLLEALQPIQTAGQLEALRETTGMDFEDVLGRRVS